MLILRTLEHVFSNLNTQTSSKYEVNFVAWMGEHIEQGLNTSPTQPYAKLKRLEQAGHQTIELNNFETNDPLDYSFIDLKSSSSKTQFYSRFVHSGFGKEWGGYVYNHLTIESMPKDGGPNSKLLNIGYDECKITIDDNQKSQVILQQGKGQEIEITDLSGHKNPMTFRLDGAISIFRNTNHYYNSLSMPNPSIVISSQVMPKDKVKNTTLAATVRLAELPTMTMSCK